MGLFVSTAGADVVISELGITIINPTTDYDIGSQFSDEDAKHANSLTTAIRNGTLVWRKVAAGAIQAPTDYDPEWLEAEAGNTGVGAAPDQVVLRSDLTAAISTNDTYNAEAVAETSTTSQVTELTHLTLVTPSLALGNYLLEWSFDRRSNGGNKRMYVAVRDAGVLLTENNEHFADAAQISAYSMRKKLTGISGIKTFTLNYRADTNNTTVYMSEALFTLRRIL